MLNRTDGPVPFLGKMQGKIRDGRRTYRLAKKDGRDK
jgi:hypothetical protein